MRSIRISRGDPSGRAGLPALLTAAVSGLVGLVFAGGIFMAPYFMWNSRRLAWSCAVGAGYPPYPGPDAGPVLSTMYGPLAVLAYLPATLASHPVTAVILGSALSVVLYLLPMFFLLRGRPFVPFLLFCLLTLNSRPLSYSAFCIHADAPALAFGGLACYFLTRCGRKEDSRPLFLAALFSVLAVAAKQTLFPLLFAVLFLAWFRDGLASFRRCLLYLFVSGAVLSGLVFSWIPFENLYFHAVLIPSRHPWIASGAMTALGMAWMGFATQIPVLTLVWGAYEAVRRYTPFSASRQEEGGRVLRPEVLLAWVGLLLIPASLLGRVKAGGDINTFSPSLYFLAAGTSLGLARAFEASGTGTAKRLWGQVLFVVLLFSQIVMPRSPKEFGSALAIARSFENCRLGKEYAFLKGRPGDVYFPDNPLAHWFAEGRMFHNERDLYERELAGFPVSRDHFQRHIPSSLRWVASGEKPGPFGEHVGYVLKYLPGLHLSDRWPGDPDYVVHERP